MNSIKYLGLTSFKNLRISPDSDRSLSKTIFNTHLVNKYK